MKIIINEHQYSLIKEFIDEANVKDRNVMSKLGEAINNLLDEISQGKTTEFQLASGNKVILKCVSDDNYLFKFEIIDDSAKALKKWDSLEIKINPGNGDTDGTEREYKLNSSIIEPAQNGNGFTLIFQASKKTGPKGKAKLNGVTKISPSSVTKPVEQPEKQPEKQPDISGDTEQNYDEDRLDQDRLEADGKKAYEMILNDPNLKKAFYSQPKFWELFVAELRGEKATGHGIIPALRIINSYENKSLEGKLGGEFIPNKKISFQVLNTVKVPYKTNKKETKYYTFDSLSGEFYDATVKKRIMGENIKISGILQTNSLGYQLELIDKDEKSIDTFMCKLTMIVKNEQKKIKYPYNGEFKIKIDRQYSLGYRPKQESSINQTKRK